MIKQKWYKNLLIYLLIFYAISLFCAFALRNYSENKFAKTTLNELIYTKSRYQNPTDDLCKYSIHGDPKNSGTNYVKLNLYCKNNKISNNTLNTKTIPGNRYSDLIREYARIIYFDSRKILDKTSWTCYEGEMEQKIKNWNKKINPPMTINCYENKK